MAEDWKVDGFSEVVLCVQDLQVWTNFFQQLGEWNAGPTTDVADEQLAFWGGQGAGRQCLLQTAESQSSRIRLCQFSGMTQQRIREDDYCWDTGGIVDINIRINNTDYIQQHLADRNWRAFSEPVAWKFGDNEVVEWLSQGPDGVTIAFIERVSPPLINRNFKHISHTFNSSQIVNDMPAALSFYKRLGFEELMHHAGPLPGISGKVLGLDAEEAPNTEVEIYIVQPQGQLDGSVELVTIDKPGKDFADCAQPYNLGISALRFPVSNIGSYARHLEKNDIAIEKDTIVQFELPPYGKVASLAVQTPDGTWLEFFEPL